MSATRIDRARIAREAAALNLASAAASKPLDSVVFMANSLYHERNWSTYRHRPTRARQLLERAGCRPGADGIYVCDGDRLSLRFTTTAGVQRRELMVRLAQAQLREVGIGQRMFEEICRRLKAAGVTTVRTMVNRDHKVTLSFFRAQGLRTGRYVELEKEIV